MAISEKISDLIIEQNEKDKERRHRKDEFKRETISPKLLSEYEGNGWMLDRELSTRVRVKKEKSIDEKWENKIWLLLNALGFDELNKGRHFKITFDRKDGVQSEKQIDVFAKDESTVIVCECKTAKTQKRKTMQKDVEEFANLKGSIAQAIKKHYGSSFKPKIIWLIASQNIIWSQPDLDRAKGEQIHVVHEKDVRYFWELANHLGQAGKYQFLAHFLDGQKIPELDNMFVPAIRGKLGGQNFYAFVATPEQLLKISFVNHRTLNDPRSAPSYQRLISKSRMKNIGKFLENGGFFPTNIILNFSKKPRFDIREKNDATDVHFGNLQLPNTFKSAWVIDGQHRLYSYAGLENLKKSGAVFTLAFEKLTKEKEANLFVEINHEQKSVPKTLLDDLKGELDWGSSDPRKRIAAMSARTVNILNEDFGEALADRVVKTGLRVDETATLTLPAIVEALKLSKLLGSIHSKTKEYKAGCFSRKDDFATVERARTVLNYVFGQIKASNTEAWFSNEVGLCRNVSIQAFMLLFEEFCNFYSKTSGNDPVELSENELMQSWDEYLEPLKSKLSTENEVQLTAFFRDGIRHGSSGKRDLFFKLVSVTREAHPNFGPDDFVEWEKSQDEQRFNEVTNKIQKLNEIICETLFNEMKKLYGEADYFDKSVTNKEWHKDAYGKSLDDPIESRAPLEQYLDLIQYRKIIEKSDHWPHLKQYFDIPLSPQDKGRSKNLKWLDELNDIRKKTTHKGKDRRLSVEEMEKAETIYEELVSKIQINDEEL